MVVRCAFLVLRQRALKPHLVEQGQRVRPAVRGVLPERECFRTLIPRRKGMVAQEDSDQALEHLGLGVGYASLPILYAAPVDADLLRERDLREPDARP